MGWGEEKGRQEMGLMQSQLWVGYTVVRQRYAVQTTTVRAIHYVYQAAALAYTLCNTLSFICWVPTFPG